MMKKTMVLSVIAILFCVTKAYVQDIHGGGSHDGTYFPGSGVTIWEESSVGRVIYMPTSDGAEIHLTGDDYYIRVNCQQEPEKCKELLEGATKPADTPDEPDKDGKKPGGEGQKPGKGGKKPSKGGKNKNQSAEIESLLAGAPTKLGDKVYIMNAEGKWIEVKNGKMWKQKIKESIK